MSGVCLLVLFCGLTIQYSVKHSYSNVGPDSKNPDHSFVSAKQLNTLTVTLEAQLDGCNNSLVWMFSFCT